MKKMVFGLLAITLPMFVSWVTMNVPLSPAGIRFRKTASGYMVTVVTVTTKEFIYEKALQPFL